MSVTPLKKGDSVIMHTCMEAESHDGQIWVCKSDEFKQHPEHNYTVIMLEGFSGSFATKYLQKVNFEFSYKDFLDNASNYENLVMENAGLINFKSSAETVLNEEQLKDIEDEMQNIPETIY